MIEDSNDREPVSSRAIRVRLPGFLIDDPKGLGDVIKHATRSLGIEPCGGCEARAKALNRWVVFTGAKGDGAGK